MSDSRWTDVDRDIDDALRHLGMALRIFDAGGFDAPDLEGYKSSTSFMHAMATGYTSVENAVKRILDILGETPPSGEAWHRDLLERVARPMPGTNARPALFDEEMRRDLLECLRMRHRVRHSDYDEFVPTKAEPTVDAVRRVIKRIKQTIAQFRKKIDPDPSDENDGGDGAGGGASGGPPI
ncbi:hypothetical protein AAFX91_17405 [Bradyrhizobium sp. 31Argb]|uniref:ribonuclease toxin HepT-like protein n=1 Tax=unclassified Bradyrhizobium TaxID=2631580 RepID=UPI00249DAB3D|nr:hypothetical protein [Bradyrhizobium sp. Arg237L]MDI4239444.1 hypothetical protein [Bradyrhizobium sp. Arg237L]